MKMNKVMFMGVECAPVFGLYKNLRLCIHLKDPEGMPFATATMNEPGLKLEAGQTLVKDYSENKGMVKALEQAGIVRPLYPHPVGRFGAETWVCQLCELDTEEDEEFERAY
jgi:hypothetical protein